MHNTALKSGSRRLRTLEHYSQTYLFVNESDEVRNVFCGNIRVLFFEEEDTMVEDFDKELRRGIVHTSVSRLQGPLQALEHSLSIRMEVRHPEQMCALTNTAALVSLSEQLRSVLRSLRNQGIVILLAEVCQRRKRSDEEVDDLPDRVSKRLGNTLGPQYSKHSTTKKHMLREKREMKRKGKQENKMKSKNVPNTLRFKKRRFALLHT